MRQVPLESQAAKSSKLMVETINLLPAPTEPAPPLTERDSLRILYVIATEIFKIHGSVKKQI
jgi:hypothetical protein